MRTKISNLKVNMIMDSYTMQMQKCMVMFCAPYVT